MRILACITVAMAALFAAAAPASAQYYSGPGFGVYVGPRDRDYYEDRRYEERRYRQRYEDRYERYGRYDRPRGFYDERTGQTYFRPRGGHCPPRYTIQDGLCKPYRGY